MKTDLIFSFDTEDFTSNSAADAIYREAEILRRNGIRGCFCVVGLLAQQLRAWKRRDVIDALSHHEIALHTWGHTYHPTINEYTDTKDFQSAYREVLRQETEACRMLSDTFGTDTVYAAVPPGNQKSYAAMYAYADMGIPIYADTVCDTPVGDGMYYCNLFHMDYAFAMESCFFETACDDAMLRGILDRLAGRGHAIVYTHPHIAMYSRHWDSLNYYKENRFPFGHWTEAPRRPEAETERFYRNMERFTCLAKEDERFSITTYKEIADRLNTEPPRVITKADLSKLKAHLAQQLYPYADTVSYSLSDLFCACCAFLGGSESYTCKKVFGFLSMPDSAPSPCSVTAQELRKAAETIPSDGFLPESVTIGAKRIGPADFLMAAMDILCGAASAEILPGRPQLPSLDAIPQTRDLAFAGTWMHSDDFKDLYLSDRLRLQSWTMRHQPQNRLSR